MKLSIIVPTISGREDSLAQTLDAYAKLTHPYLFEFVVGKDHSCWPAACNAGAIKAQGEILHFTADDLVPVLDWFTPTLPTLLADELPAPCIIWNHEQGGTIGSDDGAHGELTRFTRVPIMTRAQYDRIGPWPELIYYADLWVSDRGRSLGMETRCVSGYEFVHHWSQIGRLDGDEKAMDAAYQEYQRLVSQL